MSTPLETIREIIAKQLNIPMAKIKEHTALQPLFDEYETTKLDIIDITLALEDVFEVEIHVEELMNWKNPQDAYTVIKTLNKTTGNSTKKVSQITENKFPINF